MSFLAPLFLTLGALAAVPLLIHLWRRRLDRRVEFPAARYVARAEREHSRRLRLRNLLLMVLRVAIVLFIALAAARPVTRLAAGSGHAPTAVAIVLDNSLSSATIVDGRPVHEILRRHAHQVLDRATPGDRLYLVTAEGRARGGDPPMLRSLLGRIEPLAIEGDLPAAVARAGALVSGSGLAGRQIIVLTDAQASSWRERVDAGDAEVVVVAPPVRFPANRAVVSAAAQPARWTPRGAVAATIRATDSATYRITLADAAGEARTLARGAAVPTALGMATVAVRAAPPERGWVAGSVELEPDELRADDVRHFAVWIGPPPQIVVRPAAGPFVEAGIATLVESGQLARGEGEEVAQITAADALPALPAFITAPLDPVRLGAANRALERAGVPWRFGDRAGGTAAVRGERLDEISVSQRYALEATGPGAAAADTLATVGGAPWIVAGEGYVLLASPLHPDATDLPVRAAFVPWLAETIAQRLAGGEFAVIESAPAATVRRPAWATDLESSDGERVAITGPTVQSPSTPGVYFLHGGAGRAGALVVNPDSGESVLSRLSEAELAERVRGDDVLVVRGGPAFEAALFSTGARRPLVVPLLVAALAALLVESLLASQGGRRAASASRAAA